MERSSVGWPVIGFSTIEPMYPGMPILDYEKLRIDVVALAWGQAWGDVEVADPGVRYCRTVENKRIGFKLDMVLVRHEAEPRQGTQRHRQHDGHEEMESYWLAVREQADRSLRCMHNRGTASGNFVVA
jgi:hypothetical protein